MKLPTTQEHTSGCGAACVAFVADISYNEAVRILNKKQASIQGYYCKELLTGLKKLGHEYTHCYLKPKLKRRIYQNGTIVFIQKSARYPSGHYPYDTKTYGWTPG